MIDGCVLMSDRECNAAATAAAAVVVDVVVVVVAAVVVSMCWLLAIVKDLRGAGVMADVGNCHRSGVIGLGGEEICLRRAVDVGYMLRSCARLLRREWLMSVALELP